jgi:hypothetical protein
MNKHIYLICDENNNVARIVGIIMFGVKVDMPAMFCEEDQALSVLFEMEEAGLLNDIPHAVRKIDQCFTSSVG